MVDWKKIPKIDAHIHLLPQDVIDANKGYSDRFVDYGDYDSYLNLMEKYNIEIAFIMPFNDCVFRRIQATHLGNCRPAISAIVGHLQ